MLKELARLNLGSFALGLPALLGVLLGMRLYTGGRPWVLAAAAALVLLWFVMRAGRFMLTTFPRVGAWIIETWIVSAILVTAFITGIVLFLGLSEFFPAFLGDATGKTLEKLSATLVGAVTTFTALVWTKDISDSKGYFWPSTQCRIGFEDLYQALSTRPPGNTPAYNAIFMETVPDTDIDGWSFLQRHARAKIVADYLATHP